MSMRLENYGNDVFFIFNDTRQKPYFSPTNPDILVNECPSINQAGGHTLVQTLPNVTQPLVHQNRRSFGPN